MVCCYFLHMSCPVFDSDHIYQFCAIARASFSIPIDSPWIMLNCERHSSDKVQEYEAGSLITIDHNVTWRHIPLSYEYSHTHAFYPELVNNEHALALYSRTIYSKVCNFQKYVESVVFCCILKKNKIQITLINQKLSRHQSIY